MATTSVAVICSYCGAHLPNPGRHSYYATSDVISGHVCVRYYCDERCLDSERRASAKGGR